MTKEESNAGTQAELAELPMEELFFEAQLMRVRALRLGREGKIEPSKRVDEECEELNAAIMSREPKTPQEFAMQYLTNTAMGMVEASPDFDAQAFKIAMQDC